MHYFLLVGGIRNCVRGLSFQKWCIGRHFLSRRQKGSKSTSYRHNLFGSLRMESFSSHLYFVFCSIRNTTIIYTIIYRVHTQSACTSSIDPPVPFLTNKTNGNSPRSANPRERGKEFSGVKPSAFTLKNSGFILQLAKDCAVSSS